MNDAQKNKKNVVIGLTGQTGAGKSTVSELLVKRGFSVIDADAVARQVVQKGKRCLIDLALAFGVEILDAAGNLDRRKLGSIIFAEKAKRIQLNKIIFPYIQEEIKDQITACKRKGKTVIFLDAPTLFESGSDRYCDQVVSVIAPQALRLERILARDGLSEQDARNRIASQHKDEFYTSHSHFVIVNDGEFSHLRVQMMEMLEVCCRGVLRTDSGEEGDADL